MGGIIKAVVSLITVTVVTVSIGWVGTIIGVIVSDPFKNFMLDQLGNILSIFGIAPEDVINTQVIDQRLYSEDIAYNNLITQIALEHQQTDTGIMELLATKTANTRMSYNSYFSYGENTFAAGLPTTNLSAAVVPTATVIPIIAGEYGFTPTIITSRIGVPTKDEWTEYKLNKLYGYLSWTGILVYTGKQYLIESNDYNFSTNQYDIGIYRSGTQTTETTITITNIDATTDNKNTHIVVSIILAEETIVLSDTSTDEVIPIGSEVDSYTIDSVPGTYGHTVISIAAPSAVRHYIVQFYETDNSQWYYWIYQIGSGNTTLDNANTYITELEMMPIVELRNNGVNTNSAPTSTKYLQSKEILNYVGIDIDSMTDSINQNPDIASITDAYIYFGLDLNVSHPITAKMFYNLFDFVFFDADLQSTGDVHSYTATFQEGNFNAALSWQTQTRNVVNGTIGIVGTYYNTTVGGTTVIVRKQETENQYVEYVIENIANTVLVKRGGMYGVVVKTPNDGPLNVPLSKFFIDQLTPIEQLILFRMSLRLATYAANITHLEWYETAAFFNLIKIVLYAVAIVAFIISAGQAASLSQFLVNTALIIGASLAFKALLASTNNVWLKALYIAVAAFAAVESGLVDPSAIGFWTADQITTTVTQFTEFKNNQLQEDINEYRTLADKVLKELAAKTEAVKSYLSTEFVAGLTSIEAPAMLAGPDLQMYKAIEMQYDWDMVKGSRAYSNMYDYDKYYRIGVV